MEDYSGRVRRAVLWHRGQLPPNESLPRFDMYVTGIPIHGDVDEPTYFHTYACLYPAQGVYVAMNTAEWEGYSVAPQEIRDTIAAFTPPPEKVEAQRRVAAEAFPGSSAAMRWRLACTLTDGLRLPVACMAFGHTQRGGKLSVYQISEELAPLVKVAQEFKRAAPQISKN